MSLEIGLNEKLKIIRFADKEGTILYFDFIVKETGESMVVSEDELIRSINENELRRRAADMDTLVFPDEFRTHSEENQYQISYSPYSKGGYRGKG